MSPRHARLCRPRRLPHPARPREKPGFSTWESEIPRDTDSPLEGGGFRTIGPRKISHRFETDFCRLHDGCRSRKASLLSRRGTEGSNPPPSSGEFSAFRDLPRRARRSSRRLADASLYQRFHALGWKELQCFPQLVAVKPGSPRLARYQQQILAALSPAETEAWRRATAKGHTSSPSPSIAQSGPNLPEREEHGRRHCLCRAASVCS